VCKALFDSESLYPPPLELLPVTTAVSVLPVETVSTVSVPDTTDPDGGTPSADLDNRTNLSSSGSSSRIRVGILSTGHRGR
jgi:hypothetical protein